MNFKRKLVRNLVNIPGWRTKRKIVVFESDDWGSVRMPSKSAYNSLLKSGIRVDLCPYNKFDTLASKEDLDCLFETLLEFKDFKGNSPVFTANTNVANPNFRKIAQVNFEKYHYEHFTETQNSYFDRNDVFTTWKKGMESKIFFPQLHGREHVNPIMWMQLLRENHAEIKNAFEHNTFGLSRITSPNIKRMHLASLIFENKEEQKIIENSIVTGAAIFDEIFGFKSKSFIAPVYIWDKILESTLNEVGVTYIQGGNSHNNFDSIEKKIFRVERHFCGNKNKHGQIYLVRNCFFEPSLTPNFQLESVLKEIDVAFKWNKPAIITTHRLNFIGSLHQENRDSNIKMLKELLRNILKKWPNTEFMSSVDLGHLIENT